MRVGISIYCLKCGLRKTPRGRSAPMIPMCNPVDCDGWALEPRVGDLWPGESEEEFGFPVSSDGTILKPDTASIEEHHD